MKYIVTENEDGVREIFVFSRLINHDCMAEVISGIKNHSSGNWKRIRRKPISAGFVNGKGCGGESISLRLKSNPEEDTKLLQSFEGWQYAF